jgi:hypothetical protein
MGMSPCGAPEASTHPDCIPTRLQKGFEQAPGITHFSIETGGTFDLDAELKIWISGSAAPFQKQFNKKLSIYEVQSVLASYVLK